MFNYAKFMVTINGEIMAKVNLFNETARTLATESVAHTTRRKALEETLNNLIAKDDAKTEDIKKAKGALDSENDTWKNRQTELNKVLFGGKTEDGKKVEGVCDFIPDDLYKAYVAYVKDGALGTYKNKMKDFVVTVVTEDTANDKGYNNMVNDLLMVMASTKYNSSKNLADGCAYITTNNKRTFKKMFCGALVDLTTMNRTLKVAKKKDDSKKASK